MVLLTCLGSDKCYDVKSGPRRVGIEEERWVKRHQEGKLEFLDSQVNTECPSIFAWWGRAPPSIHILAV